MVPAASSSCNGELGFSPARRRVNRAALLASLVLAGGAAAWAVSRRAARGSAAPAFDAFAELERAADVVVDSIVNAVTPGPWVPPDRAAPYLQAIYTAENRYGIPRNMLARLLWQESRYREDIITGATRSPAGALGIAQFMPATAAEFGIDPLDTAQAIDAAGKYLRRLYDRFGAWDQALAAYNWGQGNHERKDLADGIVGDDWPRETREYVSSIMRDVGLA